MGMFVHLAEDFNPNDLHRKLVRAAYREKVRVCKKLFRHIDKRAAYKKYVRNELKRKLNRVSKRLQIEKILVLRMQKVCHVELGLLLKDQREIYIDIEFTHAKAFFKNCFNNNTKFYGLTKKEKKLVDKAIKFFFKRGFKGYTVSYFKQYAEEEGCLKELKALSKEKEHNNLEESRELELEYKNRICDELGKLFDKKTTILVTVQDLNPYTIPGKYYQIVFDFSNIPDMTYVYIVASEEKTVTLSEISNKNLKKAKKMITALEGILKKVFHP